MSDFLFLVVAVVAVVVVVVVVVVVAVAVAGGLDAGYVWLLIGRFENFRCRRKRAKERKKERERERERRPHRQRWKVSKRDTNGHESERTMERRRR